ncbi:Uma2 family endonuclease [Paraliomyxa miuraensis]|uniref:Uma2 family endonuclease n=1 Tax=Paraliomyxa miuraensis TaxID=376150 RepID=UPI002259E982|nr:Uma2 family endonuclease [Paraliomyxa miuraensis]MCX4245317.1 Uma2 family endonuclease [Paraliomyxa miuraensis]
MAGETAGDAAHDLSYEQYLALAESAEDWLEYHDGIIVAMVAPSPEHARIVAQLVRLLSPREARPCAALPAGLKVRVEATNRTLLPDVTVVCGSLERSVVDPQAITNPVVVFEVLSPSTEDYDLGPKFHQYRRLASLREYVVIAQERRFASISRRAGDLWAFEDVGPGDELRLPSLELQLPLDALYRDALGEIVPRAR